MSKITRRSISISNFTWLEWTRGNSKNKFTIRTNTRTKIWIHRIRNYKRNDYPYSYAELTIRNTITESGWIGVLLYQNIPLIKNLSKEHWSCMLNPLHVDRGEPRWSCLYGFGAVIKDFCQNWSILVSKIPHLILIWNT